MQTSQATIEIKELGVDASKDGGSKSALFVKLHLLPIVAHLGVARISSDQSSSFSGASYNYGYQAFSTLTERAPVPFLCEEFYLSCEFGHVRLVFFFFLYRSLPILFYKYLNLVLAELESYTNDLVFCQFVLGPGMQV